MMRLSLSWFGLVMVFLLALAMVRLLTSAGKRAVSVRFFLGQMAWVLGALVLIVMLLNGVAILLTYDQQHSVHGESRKAGLAKVAARFQKQPAVDTPIPIDKLWDRINKTQITVPTVRAELMAAAETSDVGTSNAATGKGAASAVGPEDVDKSEESATQEEKGNRDEPVDDHHEEAAAVSPRTGDPVEEDPVAEDSTGKTEPRISAAMVEADPVAFQERPDWVVHPPKRVGNSYRRVVTSGPYSTVEECHQELAEILRQAVYQRMAAAGADDPAYRDFTPATFAVLGIGIEYIYREICRDEFVQRLDTSVGPMNQVYLLMEFDPPIEQHLANVWRQYQVQHRLGIVAFLASAGLLLLGLVYGLLKVDTWTRGYYSKRLLLGVPAVIIGLILLWLV